MIKIRIGSGFFSPRLWPTLLTLIFLPVLLGLGAWQVQRLHWKRELIATIDQHIHQAPIAVPVANAAEADYQPATASGTYLHDRELFVIATEQKSGQGGYHVLTPLQLTDGQILLVDRGWIPYASKSSGFARPMGVVQMQGILRLPKSSGFLQPANDPAKSFWYSVDLQAMAAAARIPAFLPYVLEADAAPNEGGYPVGGQTRLSLPNDHFSYAVTWYSLAAILLIIYGVASYRKD